MNTTALLKALRFACLPTLSLLLLLFFAFFSISDTIAFISSSDSLAVMLRIAAFIAEVYVIYLYYVKYTREEIMKGNSNSYSRRQMGSRTDLYDIKSHWSSSDDYYIQDTEDSDVVYVQRVK